MRKFDTSSGLSQKQIGSVKYNIKQMILRQLPLLPEIVENKLFLQGRDPWIYGWELKNNQFPIESKHIISIEVVVRLKKEFHQYVEQTQYTFLCKVKLTEDTYRPKVSIAKKV